MKAAVVHGPKKVTCDGAGMQRNSVFYGHTDVFGYFGYFFLNKVCAIAFKSEILTFFPVLYALKPVDLAALMEK